ncbi:hypothetical protein [Halobacterium noricense]|nr:hypothetical protein [Halobacterium noricense]UHH25352.1 hypothetical protein LT974_00010 [Halobacterium noricense]
MQDGDDLGIGLGSPPNNPSTDGTSLADVFWMLLPVVLVFGLFVGLLVFA